MIFQTVTADQGQGGANLAFDQITQSGTTISIPYGALCFGALGGGSYTPVTTSTPLPVQVGDSAGVAATAAPTNLSNPGIADAVRGVVSHSLLYAFDSQVTGEWQPIDTGVGVPVNITGGGVLSYGFTANGSLLYPGAGSTISLGSGTAVIPWVNLRDASGNLLTALTTVPTAAARALSVREVTSSAATATGTVATGAANTVIRNTATVLGRVLVTTAGTGAGSVLIYDNASTNSGTVIGVIPATVAIGAVYDFQIPAANGVVVTNVLNGPALTVSYR